MSSLRIGLAVSGLLHAALIAAFARFDAPEIPPLDDAKSLTLQLSAFEPPRAAMPAAPAGDDAPPVDELVEDTPPAEPQTVAAQQPTPPEQAPIEQRPEVAAVQTPPPRPKVERVVKKAVVDRPRPTRPEPRTAAQTQQSTVAAPISDRPSPALPVVSHEQKQHYLAVLAARIDRSKYYPKLSRRLGEEGTVVVSFVIERSGHLSDLAIVESSGHRRLDRAALKTLRRVSPFLPIPDGLQRDNWPISVPISFHLRS